MTELERKRIVQKHRLNAAAILRMQGYDKTIYLAYLFVRDDEKDYGNKIELLDLLW